jgi:hypothetical protein
VGKILVESRPMSAANTVRDSSTVDLSSRSAKLKHGAISEASLALHSQSKHSASMDEYAAELAEVGRMMRDGEFDARAAVNGQTDIGAIPSTIIQRVRCRSHNVKSWRKS